MELRRARLYFHTLRHARSWQVAGRLFARVKPFTAAKSLPHTLSGGLSPRVPFTFHDPWNSAAEIQDGQFRFLDRVEKLGQPVDWQRGSVPLLWLFNLHYFNYLHLLEDDARVELCRSWVTANPPGTDAAWHPYPTSLRIVNWCKNQVRQPELLRSMYLQASFLYRNLETHILGNHLLENARALILAGYFFEGQGESHRWLSRGLSVYERELNEQILPDGMHFELSPMYHALMLDGVCDVLSVTPKGHHTESWLMDYVERMSDVLAMLTHPDGEIAHFNDSTHEIATPTAAILRRSRQLSNRDANPPVALPDAGYYVVHDDAFRMVVDAGPVGPRYLTAHSHADIFSYELSVNRHTFVTDTGVFEYQAGDARKHDRSTLAHNTVSVDSVDQAECWGSFRVARRFAPYDIEFQSKPDSIVLTGSFSGYSSLIGDEIVHHRKFRYDRGAGVIEVIDMIDGTGKHLVESSVHLHPDVLIQEHGDLLRLTKNGAECLFSATVPYSIEERPYSPRFGQRIMRKAIVMRRETDLPTEMAYHFRIPQ